MKSSTGLNSRPHRVAPHRAGPHRGGQDGFTLLEVTVAVALLATALTVIVGLQTRLVDTMIQERNLFRASLYAQYVLTFLDVDIYPPDPGTTKGSIEDLLEKRGYFDDDLPGKSRGDIKRWSYIQDVQAIDFGEFKDVLRRISFTTRWGEGSGEQTSFVYFMVSDPFGTRLQQLQSKLGSQ